MAKILAIDDNNDNLITLGAIIKESFPDLDFDTALSGKKGIELAISSNPDVILLGVNMPDMDGFEVCRRLKQDERSRDIPVVFLTAVKEDKGNRIKAIVVGGEAFLNKPIDATELVAQIRAMVKIKEFASLKRNENGCLSRLVAEWAQRLHVTGRGSHHLATAYALNTQSFHQPLHRAAGNAQPLSVHLLPDLIGPVDTHIDLPDMFDVRSQRVVPLDPGTAQIGIALLGGMAPIT